MAGKTSGGWWTRNLWVIVLFPLLAAALLAGVSVFKGWLHQRAGFDDLGRPVVENPGGAPDPKKDAPPVKPRTPLSVADAYGHIVPDLQRRDPDARAELRYLSLLHRHNEPTCTDADLEADRGAVRELAAVLWRGRTAHGGFIDPDQLLFRIDLADFDWDAATDWRGLVAQYRYGLAGGPEPLAKLRRQAEEWTQDGVPVVRADWFVAAVTRPPLAGPKGLLRTPAEFPEAVRVLGRQYAAQTLDLAACARELGVEDAPSLADLIRREDRLQQEFGLAPLLKGERIRREWWESDRNLISPYQELARQLKLGQPVRVQ